MRPVVVTIDEERSLALRDRAAGWAKGGLLQPDEAAAVRQRFETGGRQVGPIARVALFVLTLMAFSAAMSLVMLIGLPIMMAGSAGDAYGGLALVQGVISFVTGLALAEFLLSGARLRRTGIEDALYLSGPFGLLFAIAMRWNDVSPLLFAICAGAIFTAAAWRLRRGLWYALAALSIVIGIGVELESVTTFAAASVVIGVLAGLAGVRGTGSPSAHTALSIIAATFPAIGLAVSYIDGAAGEGLTDADLAFGAAIVAIALAGFVRVRWKALLYSALLTGLVLIVDVIDRLALQPEYAVIAIGVAVVAAARILSNALAGRERGLTSTPLAASELEALEPLAGAIAGAATAPRDTTPADGGPVLDSAEGGADSSFGGAGATERF